MRIADLLWHNERQQPARVALRIDGQPRSWHELAEGVRATAAHLSAFVSPGDRVGLWFHNGYAWVECFLALNALGAVCVPINTRLTGQELRQIFGIAQLHALVTTPLYRGRRYTEEARAVLQDCGARVHLLEAHDASPPGEWRHEVLNAKEQPYPGGGTPADVFCIQYTSGTTAVPKGVMLTDAAYIATAAYVARCQRLTPSSRFASAAPFFHCSGSMHALTVCLLAGCTLHSMSVWDPQRYLDTVAEYGCDVSHMVYYRDVLALPAQARARERLASMQVTHDLGTPDFLRRIHDELGIGGVSNLYGMTETCGQFTMWFPDDPLEQRITGNGRPQAGNEVRIADPDTGNEVARGETGEIQMRGFTVSPGYFRNPGAQAAAFTADGWFRSGDLGRIGDDGQLVYVARLKEMIRVGGENLAPAEVEQALRDVCGVGAVCVLGVPDPRLDEVPAAVLVRPATQDWPAAMAQLRQRLAGFKLPRAVYVADELPMTATNRVQRATLQAWIRDNRLQRVV
ncbi:MAG TPA: class I adenylate-forming enzyme family protein [Ramlibacter sp.]|nr:class I adenylate-forming enzyme family protein [Ramlibacter sp.]